MKKGISKEMEIREVMKWQLLIAGAVDAAIKGTESYIRHMELTRQQGGGIAVKNRKTGREIRALCAVEMWITGYGAMENAIHSTWKSQSAAFPRPANSVSHSPKRAASYPHSHTADDYGKKPFLPVIHKKIF